MVTVLAGCASGSDMQPSRTAYDPGALQAGSEITAARQIATAPQVTQMWWTKFGDAQLNTLMDLAEHDSPSIQIAESRLQEARAASADIASNLLPTLDGSASVNADHFPGHYTYPDPYAGNYGSDGEIGADLVYHVDFWGKWHKAADAARLRVEAADFETADAKLVLETALVSAYVKLDAAYRLRDVATQGLARRDGILHLLDVRQQAGLSTDINAVTARDAITETRADIARYTAEIARRQHEIAALLGKTPAFADTLSRPAIQTLADPSPVSDISATLLGYRPDVSAQRSVVEAAAKEIGVAKAAFYPDVNLVAFAGLQSLGLGYLMHASSTMASIGPAITLPIFEGGRLRAHLKGRVAEYDEAVSAYDAAIVTALQQVADGIVTVKAARERQQEAQEAASHWTHVVDLQRIRQRNGLSDTSDLLATETALLMSQRREAETDAEVADAQVSLIRALGGAWSPSSSITSARINHG
jgi:NodT family efflux transporter outer membrane factor (OMF) lipoprotein